ncbi:hypothetical protein NFJ02_34g86240 [Pycnococcus provasolii]
MAALLSRRLRSQAIFTASRDAVVVHAFGGVGSLASLLPQGVEAEGTVKGAVHRTLKASGVLGALPHKSAGKPASRCCALVFLCEEEGHTNQAVRALDETLAYAFKAVPTPEQHLLVVVCCLPLSAAEAYANADKCAQAGWKYVHLHAEVLGADSETVDGLPDLRIQAAANKATLEEIMPLLRCLGSRVEAVPFAVNGVTAFPPNVDCPSSQTSYAASLQSSDVELWQKALESAELRAANAQAELDKIAAQARENEEFARGAELIEGKVTSLIDRLNAEKQKVADLEQQLKHLRDTEEARIRDSISAMARACEAHIEQLNRRIDQLELRNVRLLRASKCLSQWRKRTSYAKQVRKAFWHWMHSLELRALRTWSDMTASRRYLRRMAVRALARWKNQMLGEAWFGWQYETEVKRQSRAIARRALGRLIHRRTSEAFVSWSMEVDVCRHERLKARASLLRWMHNAQGYAFRALRDRVNELAVSRAIARRALGRLIHRRTSEAFVSWSIEVDVCRHERKRATHAALLWRSHMVGRAFRGLRHITRDLKYMRRITKRAITSWKMREVRVAFAGWHRKASMLRRMRHLTNRALKHWLNGRLSRSFQRFRELALHAVDSPTMKKLGNNAIQRVCRRICAAAFTGWHHRVITFEEQRSKIRRTLKHWKMHKLSRAFRAFVANTNKARRLTLEKVADNALRRMQDRLLTAAFYGWVRTVEMLKAQLARVRRAISHFRKRELATAFNGFHYNVQRAKYYAQLLRPVTARVQSLAAAYAFDGWYERACSLRRMHHIALRAVHFFSKRTLATAFNGFYYNVQRAKYYAQLLRRVTARVQSLVAACAFDGWYERACSLRRMYHVASRAVRYYVKRTLATAFNAFKSNARMSARKFVVASMHNRAVRRMRSTLTSQGFYGWLHRFRDIRRQRMLVSRAHLFWVNRMQRTIFNAFHDHAEMLMQDRRVAMICVSKGRARIESSAFAGWCERTDVLREMRTLARRALKFLTTHKLACAFSGFKHNVDFLLIKRGVARRVALHWSKQKVSSAWHGWICFLLERRETKRRSVGAILRMQGNKLYHAFDSWRQTGYRLHRERWIATKALTMCTSRLERKALWSWKYATCQWKRNNRIAKRLLFNSLNLLIAKAYRGWHDALVRARYIEQRIAATLFGWQCQELLRAFTGWHDVITDLRAQRRVANVVMRRMLNYRAHKALRAWLADHAQFQRVKRVARRIRSLLVASAFDGWSFAILQAHAHKRHAMVVIARLKNRKLAWAFAGYRHRAMRLVQDKKRARLAMTIMRKRHMCAALENWAEVAYTYRRYAHIRAMVQTWCSRHTLQRSMREWVRVKRRLLRLRKVLVTYTRSSRRHDASLILLAWRSHALSRALVRFHKVCGVTTSKNLGNLQKNLNAASDLARSLQADLDAAHRQRDDMAAAVERERGSIADAEQANVRLTQELQKERDRLLKEREAASKLDAGMKELQRALRSKERELQDGERGQRNLEFAVGSLKEELQQGEKQVQTLTSQMDGMSQRVVELESELEKKAREVDAAALEIRRHENAVKLSESQYSIEESSRRAELAAKENSLADVTHRLREVEKELSTKKVEAVRLEDETRALHRKAATEAAEHESVAKDLAGRLRDSETRMNDAEREVAAKRMEIENLEHQLKLAEHDRRQNFDSERLRKQQLLMANDSEFSRLRAELSERDEKHMRQIAELNAALSREAIRVEELQSERGQAVDFDELHEVHRRALAERDAQITRLKGDLMEHQLTLDKTNAALERHIKEAKMKDAVIAWKEQTSGGAEDDDGESESFEMLRGELHRVQNRVRQLEKVVVEKERAIATLESNCAQMAQEEAGREVKAIRSKMGDLERELARSRRDLARMARQVVSDAGSPLPRPPPPAPAGDSARVPELTRRIRQKDDEIAGLLSQLKQHRAVTSSAEDKEISRVRAKLRDVEAELADRTAELHAFRKRSAIAGTITQWQQFAATNPHPTKASTAAEMEKERREAENMAATLRERKEQEEELHRQIRQLERELQSEKAAAEKERRAHASTLSDLQRRFDDERKRAAKGSSSADARINKLQLEIKEKSQEVANADRLRAEISRLETTIAALRREKDKTVVQVVEKERVVKVPAPPSPPSDEMKRMEKLLSESEASLERALAAKAKAIEQLQDHGHNLKRLEHERSTIEAKYEKASKALSKAQADLKAAHEEAHEAAVRSAASAKTTTAEHSKQSRQEREVMATKLSEAEKARKLAEEKYRESMSEVERLRVALTQAEARRKAAVADAKKPAALSSPAKHPEFQKVARENTTLRRAVSTLEERLLKGVMIKVKANQSREMSLIEAHGIHCGCPHCEERKAGVTEVSKAKTFKDSYLTL